MDYKLETELDIEDKGSTVRNEIEVKSKETPGDKDWEQVIGS